MTDPRKPARTRLIIGPNASMSLRLALGFFLATSVVSLGLAGVFAMQGLWPVLPFAGLELGALALALVLALRSNRYREVVEFDHDRLRVQVGRLGEGVRLSREWPRGQARVWIEAGRHSGAPTRLVLGCGGQTLELGACLTDDERASLARRLRELIHPGWMAEMPRAPQRVPSA